MSTTTTSECSNTFPKYSWWSDEENIKLEKHNGKMSILATFGDNIWVDELIYKDRIRHNRIVDASCELIQYGLGYSCPVFVSIDFSSPVKEYLLLLKSDNCEYSYESFDTLEEGIDHLNSLDTGKTFCGIIVQISQMSLFDESDEEEVSCDESHIKYSKYN